MGASGRENPFWSNRSRSIVKTLPNWAFTRPPLSAEANWAERNQCDADALIRIVGILAIPNCVLCAIAGTFPP
jgi:hypothetical protein